MKTDRGRVSKVIFLLAAGVVVVLSGCVSAPPEQVIGGGEESRDPLETPIIASPDPPDPEDSPVAIRISHVPIVPQPDVMLEPPLPEPVVGSDARGIRVYPEMYQEPPEMTRAPPPPMGVTESRPWVLPVPDVAATRLSRGERALPRGSVESDAVDDNFDRRAESTDPAMSTNSTEPDLPAEVPLPHRGEDAASRSSQPQPQPRTPAPREPREDTVAERTVEVGERFQVSLPGRGWVYLGGGEALQFVDRTTAGEDVVFSFRGPPAGIVSDERTVLEFESQNFVTGSRSRHEERILIAEMDGEDGSGDQASNELRSATEAGDATTSGASGAAAISEIPENASAEELFQQFDELEASERYEAAVDLLEGMRREAIGENDEIAFRLARMYEAEWEGRDLPRARTLYRRVVENYPLSRWRRPARERIEYLNRHFFHIR